MYNIESIGGPDPRVSLSVRDSVGESAQVFLRPEEAEALATSLNRAASESRAKMRPRKAPPVSVVSRLR